MLFAQARLQHWLQQNKTVDGFLVTKKENIFWLTGFSGSVGMYLQMKSGEKFLITDSRYEGHAKELCEKAEINFVLLNDEFALNFGEKILGRFAVENSLSLAQFDRIKKCFSQAQFFPQKTILEQLRRQKNSEELHCIRLAQQQVDKVLLLFLKGKVKTGVTEREIAFGLQQAICEEGKFGISFPAIVAFGSNSAIPHHEPTDRPLEIGDNILVDCGAEYQGYASDITRNFAFRGISKEFKKKHELLLSVQKKALKKFVVGTSTAEIDQFVRSQLGMDAEFFTHSLGHGVGLEVHEFPLLSSKSQDILQENEVVTCEPGVYFPEQFGVRIEDLIVIRKNEPEILSRTTREIVLL